MFEDEERARYDLTDVGKLSTYENGIRFPANLVADESHASEFRSDFRGWVTLETDPERISELSRSVPGWQNGFSSRPTVKLGDASCKVLRDGQAGVWNAPVHLDLDGFDYRGLDVTPADFQRRLAWIRSTRSSPEKP